MASSRLFHDLKTKPSRWLQQSSLCLLASSSKGLMIREPGSSRILYRVSLEDHPTMPRGSNDAYRWSLIPWLTFLLVSGECPATLGPSGYGASRVRIRMGGSARRLRLSPPQHHQFQDECTRANGLCFFCKDRAVLTWSVFLPSRADLGCPRQVETGR